MSQISTNSIHNDQAIVVGDNARAAALDAKSIESYRTHGFVHVPQIISREEALQWREEALNWSRSQQDFAATGVFTQLVNVWRDNEKMRALTLHPNIAACARALSGVELRLWHDQILIKQPHNQKATEFHQDQPYWPHAHSTHPISCWLALGDVPVERGCMTFLPGSQQRTELPAQNLVDANSLFTIAPDLTWQQRVTVPLQAGDCTFHHGRCAHMATPNFTDEARVAHVVIFIDQNTIYDGRPHIVTDPLHLPAGAPLAGEMFPTVVD